MTTVKALEVWTAQTICDLGILLSVVSVLLHAGRPYFERILGRMTLRVAADLWWVMYVVLRDGTLFLALLFGLWHLNLDLMADIKIGLPFVPLGTVALAIALVIKVFGNTEEPNRAYRISTLFIALGAALNTAGYVFVMEGPGSEYVAARTAFWQTMVSWRSNANPSLATVTFYLTGVMLLLVGAVVAFKALALMRATANAGGAAAPRTGAPPVAVEKRRV